MYLETVSFEELLMSNVYTQEALINLLEKKGLIDEKELLEEIKRLKSKQPTKPSGRPLGSFCVKPHTGFRENLSLLKFLIAEV